MKIRVTLLSLLLALALVPAVQAQFYAITKNQVTWQNSASAPAPDLYQPFYFQAVAPISATLALPAGGTVTLPASGDSDNPYRLTRSFATKAALDAAYPAGTYRISGASIPTVSLTLPADAYPTVAPQITAVTNGTWSNGILVVNPAQPTTLTFSTFAEYTTASPLAHMSFGLWSLTTEASSLDAQVFSRPGFGNPVQAAPLTSYTIPAGTLSAGRVYESDLTFDVATAGDATSIAGAVVGALYSRAVHFYLAAQNPGTSTPAPVIASPPSSQTGVTGGSARFTVAVTAGGAPLVPSEGTAYQWMFNGTRLDLRPTGKYVANDGMNTLVVNNLTAADAGEYSVRIVTAGGIADSAAAVLSLGAASAPAITAQPRGATVNAGTTVALTVSATGNPTPAYQWRKDGQNIGGATADTLVLAAVSLAQAGNYTVVVSNSVNTVTSDAAAVVVTSNQPSLLPNLSVRTNLAAGQTLFVGFSTAGSKTMLVRAVGPTLAAFSVPGTHPDPLVELYSGSVKIDENNDWNASLTPPFAGAFPLTNGSKDAALQRACNGSYTAQVKGPGAGVLLVEAYDIGGTGKLMNVSARNQVGTDANILMAGFVVQGGAAKTLLIRGVGARLAEAFGLPGVLADPKLEIYTGAGVKVAENDNWNASLQSIARSVGAFDLTPNSRDAALLVTLPPGDYTAQVSGVGRTTGEALVEVYEVP